MSANNNVNAKQCRECPWRRASAPGWLGELPAVAWASIAHADDMVLCHLRTEEDCQCVGLAIYRANVCKIPRGDQISRDPDHAAVFSSPAEFHEHHTFGKPLPENWMFARHEIDRS